MTVADLANSGLDEKAVIDHAIKRLSKVGTVRVNVPARIYQVYGRQLTVEGADGSRSMVAMFDMGWLYQIEAKVLPRRERVRAHSLPAIVGIRARHLEPLAAGTPRHSRGVSRVGRCSQ